MKTMSIPKAFVSRRGLLAHGGLLAANAMLTAPALAAAAADVRWTMASAFPPSLDLVHGGAKTCAAALADATDGRFVMTVRAPDVGASPSDALDAVVAGTADCAHTSLALSCAQDPAYLFASGAPFGMNARQHAAWLRVGGGNEMIDALLAERGLMAIPMGSTGGQMAGWFRKEMRSHEDIAGIKVQIGSCGGKILETCGATVVNLPKEQIVEALANGQLDAFEWMAPYDDEKFDSATKDGRAAISRVAPYYYYPGWWKGETQLHLVISKQKFTALPKSYQAALRSAAALSDGCVRQQYDAENPAALKRLVVGGAELRLFPQGILEACFQAANDLYANLSQRSERFKAIADCYLAFRSDEYLWWSVAEYSFDNFMVRERRARR